LARLGAICLYDKELPILETSFESRLAAVESRIQNAAARSGRVRSDITLVAVSKKFSADHLRLAYQAGLRIFGENYVQEFFVKKPELAGLTEAKYHLIGHLQSNKAKLACELFDTIQTVDSAKLLLRLDSAAGELGKTVDILIEIKLSGETSKSGAEVGKLPEILEAASGCRNIVMLGLMTIPPWSENAEDSRPYFEQLARTAAHYKLKHLSMGMSNDMEVAIEEGATIVRVGTALFGSRPKPPV
jgi:pyridoxal phosphate enzyme (YggS family)